MRKIENAEKVLSSLSVDSDKGWISERTFVDWIGNIWDIDDFPLIPSDAASKDSPLEGDGFRAGRLEWLGFGFALSELKMSGSDKSVIIELGSSQAPWCLSWIRAIQKMQLTISTVAVGVEAGLKPGQLRHFWESQKLPGNVMERPVNLGGLDMDLIYQSDSSGEKFFIFNGAVTYKNQDVFFPEIDVTKDNGAKAHKKNQIKDYRGYSLKHKLVRSTTFLEILSLSDKINFLHLDLQGEELRIVRSLFFHRLDKKCSVLLVGTHSLRAHRYWKFLLKMRGFLVYDSNPPLITNGILKEDGEILALSRFYHS